MGVETRFIRKKQQTFRIRIKSTEGVDLGRQFEFREGTPTRAGLGRELRENAVGLMQGY